MKSKPSPSALRLRGLLEPKYLLVVKRDTTLIVALTGCMREAAQDSVAVLDAVINIPGIETADVVCVAEIERLADNPTDMAAMALRSAMCSNNTLVLLVTAAAVDIVITAATMAV